MNIPFLSKPHRVVWHDTAGFVSTQAMRLDGLFEVPAPARSPWPKPMPVVGEKVEMRPLRPHFGHHEP